MTPSSKVACFNLQARKEGDPFEPPPPLTYLPGLPFICSGPPSAITCSSTWERRGWRRSLFPWPHSLPFLPALLLLRRSQALLAHNGGGFGAHRRADQPRPVSM